MKIEQMFLLDHTNLTTQHEMNKLQRIQPRLYGTAVTTNAVCIQFQLRQSTFNDTYSFLTNVSARLLSILLPILLWECFVQSMLNRLASIAIPLYAYLMNNMH